MNAFLPGAARACLRTFTCLLVSHHECWMLMTRRTKNAFFAPQQWFSNFRATEVSDVVHGGRGPDATFCHFPGDAAAVLGWASLAAPLRALQEQRPLWETGFSQSPPQARQEKRSNSEIFGSSASISPSFANNTLISF